MGEGLREGEDEAVVAAGAVEMTDAVLLMAEPRVVPSGGREDVKDQGQQYERFIYFSDSSPKCC